MTAGSRDSPEFSRECDEVIAALDRLARGTFARCDVCGVQISDRRLRLAPAADRCMDHLRNDGKHDHEDGAGDDDSL